MDKLDLLRTFRARLVENQSSLARSLADSREGLNVDGDGRGRNRGERAAVTSQGYLADALSRRYEEIGHAIDQLDTVDLTPCAAVRAGCLVCVGSDEGVESWYLLLPGGDGARLQTPAGSVFVLSPISPLGRQMLGRIEGDVVRVPRAGHEAPVEIRRLL